MTTIGPDTVVFDPAGKKIEEEPEFGGNQGIVSSFDNNGQYIDSVFIDNMNQGSFASLAGQNVIVSYRDYSTSPPVNRVQSISPTEGLEWSYETSLQLFNTYAIQGGFIIKGSLNYPPEEKDFGLSGESFILIPEAEKGQGYIAKYDIAAKLEWVTQVYGADRLVKSNYNQGGYIVSAHWYDAEYHGYNVWTIHKLLDDGTLLWVRSIQGKTYLDIKGTALNSKGEVFVTGRFAHDAYFNGVECKDMHVSNGFYDAFLTKYASNGDYLWTKTWGGIGTDSPEEILINENDDIFIVGTFQNEVDFNIDGVSRIRTSNGYGDLYVMKLGSI